jgi:hypothetical protein
LNEAGDVATRRTFAAETAGEEKRQKWKHHFCSIVIVVIG